MTLAETVSRARHAHPSAPVGTSLHRYPPSGAAASRAFIFPAGPVLPSRTLPGVGSAGRVVR
jgi:hypothetical protein